MQKTTVATSAAARPRVRRPPEAEADPREGAKPAEAPSKDQTEKRGEVEAGRSTMTTPRSKDTVAFGSSCLFGSYVCLRLGAESKVRMGWMSRLDVLDAMLGSHVARLASRSTAERVQSAPSDARADRGRRPFMALLGLVALTLWGAGCESGSGPGPATFRVTVPGEGPANVEPVARLVPGTRSYNPWRGGFWAVGPVNQDGTVRVDSQLPFVFRETELGLEIVSQTRTASSTFEGAAVIETISPAAAEVVVPRELRDGMTWRTGPDEQYEWSARVQDDVPTPIGPRRVWTITAN